jgi:hypothetical protein
MTDVVVIHITFGIIILLVSNGDDTILDFMLGFLMAFWQPPLIPRISQDIATFDSIQFDRHAGICGDILRQSRESPSQYCTLVLSVPFNKAQFSG